MASEPMGVLLLSGAHDRAHEAFSLASTAASLGRPVTLFATGEGVRALLEDWSELSEVGRDAVLRRRGVHGFGEVRQAATDVGVRLMVCETGLKGAGLEPQGLVPGAQVSGLAAFLEAVGTGQIVAI